jgi:ATP-dependent DNA helicase DinG
VPGESLSLVVVFSLPFPEPDPLTLSKRQSAEQTGLDAFATVDLTEMLIKLRQGFGRLIRTAKDQGVVALLDFGDNQQYRDAVINSLPEGVPVLSNFGEARAKLQGNRH